MKSYSGGDACGLSEEQFMVKKKISQRYIRYIKYYYDNKQLIDEVIEEKLRSRNTKKDRQYQVFKSLLMNPLRSSALVGKEFGISGNTVRQVVYKTCAKLETESIMKPLISLFKEIVFGKLKEKELRCRELF